MKKYEKTYKEVIKSYQRDITFTNLDDEEVPERQPKILSTEGNFQITFQSTAEFKGEMLRQSECSDDLE